MLKECRRLFYPHSSNNHKAAIIQPSGLCFLIGIFIFTQASFNLFVGLVPGVFGFMADIAPEAIVELTNQKRSESGVAPLKISDQLNEAARQKAGDMFAKNYWAHVSPSGTQPWTFIKNVGYSYLYAGENLARDFYNASGVVDAWMASPTHRDNVLNEKYQDIGVAVVDGVLLGQETTLVVQMFGSQRGEIVAVTKEKPSEEMAPGFQEAAKEAEVSITPLFEKQEGTPGAILVKSMPSQKVSPWLSGFNLTKSLGLAFAGLLFGVLAFDGLIIYRRKTARVSGHNFIHGTFIIILVIMILLSQQGVIL
jgi:hypothetical protein